MGKGGNKYIFLKPKKYQEKKCPDPEFEWLDLGNFQVRISGTFPSQSETREVVLGRQTVFGHPKVHAKIGRAPKKPLPFVVFDFVLSKTLIRHALYIKKYV